VNDQAITPHSCWHCQDKDPGVCLANPVHPHYNKGLIPLPELVIKPGCPFCDIVAGQAPATIVHEWDDTIAITPLNPVVDGHTLVIPKTHVDDFAAAAYVTSRTMSKASILAHRMDVPMNLITSKGPEATQSVFHLHVHLVPRAVDDGLALPWYSGRVSLADCDGKRAAFRRGYDRGQERQRMRTAEHVMWLQATVHELRKDRDPDGLRDRIADLEYIVAGWDRLATGRTREGMPSDWEAQAAEYLAKLTAVQQELAVLKGVQPSNATGWRPS
jgi:histidine triad (HIT) family protein